MQPYINGRAYDWSAIRFEIFGRRIWGITAISYQESAEQQDNYGAGLYPVSYAPGRKEYSGSVTLELFEAVKLQDSLPPGFSLTDIPPFDAIVEYAPVGQRRVIDTLLGMRFDTNQRSVSQGDPNTMVELPFKLAGIVWGQSQGGVIAPNV